MFSEIAGSYDMLNDSLSLGIHRGWKRKTVNALKLEPGAKALDLACGTGDISFLLEKSGAKVVGIDFCADMIEIARRRASESGSTVEFIEADALDLPFDSNEFEGATMGFGIRNTESPEKCLREIARVLNPGARAAILEFGKPKGLFGSIYSIYSKTIIPIFGKALSGSRAAYDYLRESSFEFPTGEDFLDIMRKTGEYDETGFKALSGGIAYLYVGKKEGKIE